MGQLLSSTIKELSENNKLNTQTTNKPNATKTDQRIITTSEQTRLRHGTVWHPFAVFGKFITKPQHTPKSSVLSCCLQSKEFAFMSISILGILELPPADFV